MTEGETTNWSQLRDSAAAGDLVLELDDQAGESVLRALNSHLTALNDARRSTIWVERVAGFGDCPTGHALEGRFSSKANGGDDSLAKRLQEHIDQTQLMIDTITQALKNYHGTDSANANSYNTVGGQP